MRISQIVPHGYGPYHDDCAECMAHPLIPQVKEHIILKTKQETSDIFDATLSLLEND